MTAAIALCAVNVASVLILAPLFDGLMRKLTARIQSRQGPPLAQSYLDLLKLLAKEDIEVGEAPVVQRMVAALGLAAILTAACLVPMGFGVPMARYADGIMLIYILTLCAATTALAGLSAGSVYSVLGTSREIMTVTVLEPMFAVAVLVGAVNSGTLKLDVLMSGSVYGTGGTAASGVLLLIIMALAFQAYAQRQPFDITEAETEIMEGPMLEYSGPKLALFQYAKMVKLTVYASVFLGLFVPRGADIPGPLAWPIHWLKVLAVCLAVATVAAVHGRIRMDQALRRYAGLFAASLAVLVLAALGY